MVFILKIAQGESYTGIDSEPIHIVPFHPRAIGIVVQDRARSEMRDDVVRVRTQFALVDRIQIGQRGTIEK